MGPVPIRTESVDGHHFLAGAALLDTRVGQQPVVQLQEQTDPQPDAPALCTQIKGESHEASVSNYLHE